MKKNYYWKNFVVVLAIFFGVFVGGISQVEAGSISGDTFFEPFTWLGDHAAIIGGGTSTTVWWNANDWDTRGDTANNPVECPGADVPCRGFHIDVHVASSTPQITEADLEDGTRANNKYVLNGDGSPGVAAMHLDFEAIMSGRLRNPMRISSTEPGVVEFRTTNFVTTGHWWEVALTSTDVVVGGEYTAVPSPGTGSQGFAGNPGPGHHPPVDSVNFITIGNGDTTCTEIQTGVTKAIGGVKTESSGFLIPTNSTEKDELYSWRLEFHPDKVIAAVDLDHNGTRETTKTFNVTIPWSEVYVHLLGVAYQADHHPQGSCFQGQIREIPWKDVKIGPVKYAKVRAYPKEVAMDRIPMKTGWVGYDTRDTQRTGVVNGIAQPNADRYSKHTSTAFCNGGYPCLSSVASKTLSFDLSAQDAVGISRAQLIYDTKLPGSATLKVNGTLVGALLNDTTIPYSAGTNDETIWAQRSIDVSPSLFRVGTNTITVDMSGGIMFDRLQFEFAYGSAGPSLPTVAIPAVTPQGGSFTAPVSVALSTATAGAAIHYTTDGTIPTVASTRYTSPFTLNISATVTARAFLNNYNASPIASSSFIIVTPTVLPGRLEAESYKLGGEGVGYHDTTTGNTVGVHRNDGVDIEVTTDTGGGFDVGYIDATEWLAYDVNVATTGVYDIVARVASEVIGIKTLHIEVDGQNVTGAVSFTDSSGWQSWVNVIASRVSLSAGNHTVRVVMDTAGFNLNYVDVTVPGPIQPPQPPPPAGVVCNISTPIQPAAVPTFCNLNIGQAARITLKDGSMRTVTLQSVQKEVMENITADSSSGAFTFKATANVDVDGELHVLGVAMDQPYVVAKGVRLYAMRSNIFNSDGVWAEGWPHALTLMITDALMSPFNVSLYHYPVDQIWGINLNAGREAYSGRHHDGYDIGVAHLSTTPPKLFAHMDGRVWSFGPVFGGADPLNNRINFAPSSNQFDPLRSSYFHVASLAPTVSTGSTVQKGTWIGNPGLISNGGYPHLHWQGFESLLMNEFPFLRETYYATMLNQPKYQGYIKDWLVLGPFSDSTANRLLNDPLDGQETTMSPSAGSSNGGKAWKAHDNLIPGVVDLASALSPAPHSGYASKVAGYYPNHVGYAHVYVNSPVAQPVQLWLGYNDGARVWLNGSLVHEANSNYLYNSMTANSMVPDQVKLNVTLNQGWNRLLLKVSQDSNDLAAGGHFLTPNTWQFSAKFADAAGNPVSGITFQTNNPTGGPTPTQDSIPPTASLIAPAAGTTVSGTVTMSSNASDNIGVTKVEFLVDNTVKGVDTTAPHSISWDTTNAGAHPCNGAHTHSLTVKAYDAANNIGTSTVTTVNMNNPSYCAGPVIPRGISWLSTSGNKIVDEQGRAVVLRGVNLENREWIGGNISFERQAIPMITGAPPTGWGANIILIAVASGPINRGEAAYLSALDEIVSLAKQNNAYTLMVYRYAEPNAELVAMPDSGAASAMAALGARYVNEPAVLYGLQVEALDTAWSTLKPLYITMIDAIRTANSRSLVFVPGTQWSRYIYWALDDGINRPNLVWKTHPYDSWTTIQNNYRFDAVSAVYPVLIGEFGPGSYMNQADVDNLLNYAESKGMSWTAWLFNTAGCPCLLQGDKFTFTPTAYGQGIKNRLQATYVQEVPPIITPTPGISINDRVKTTAPLNVRSTPSTSGTLLGTQPIDTQGTVIGGPQVSGGFSWWNIDYDTVPDGWSVGDGLAKVSAISPLPPAGGPTPTSISTPVISTFDHLHLFLDKPEPLVITGSNFSPIEDFQFKFYSAGTSVYSTTIRPQTSNTITVTIPLASLSSLPLGFYDPQLVRVSDNITTTSSKSILVTKLGDLWAPPSDSHPDHDRDGKIDIFDVSRLQSKWGSTAPADLAEADINPGPNNISLGKIDLLDANRLMSNWTP